MRGSERVHARETDSCEDLKPPSDHRNCRFSARGLLEITATVGFAPVASLRSSQLSVLRPWPPSDRRNCRFCARGLSQILATVGFAPVASLRSSQLLVLRPWPLSDPCNCRLYALGLPQIVATAGFAPRARPTPLPHGTTLTGPSPTAGELLLLWIFLLV